MNSGVTVVNKPGGSTSIAYTYVSQRPADGHTVMVGGGSLLTNHIMGSSPLNHTDFTLIALLFNDYPLFCVSSASPIRTYKGAAEAIVNLIGGTSNLPRLQPAP